MKKPEIKDLIPKKEISGFELVEPPRGHRQYVKRGLLVQHPVKGQTFDEILAEAKDTYGIDEFVVGYSGGKDSGVVLDRLVDKKITKKVLHLDTKTGLQVTQDFVIEQCKNYNLKLNIRTPPPFPYIFAAIVLSHGFSGPFMHKMFLKYLKYKTIQKFLAEPQFKGKRVAIVTGVQKFESQARMGRYDHPITQDGEMWQVMPIFYESQGSVYRYYIENSIKKSKAYDYTDTSLECGCGSYAQRNDAEAIEALDPHLGKYFKWLEYGIIHFGSEQAKKYSKWGGIGMTAREAQHTLLEVLEEETEGTWDAIERFVCGEGCGAGTMKGMTDY